MAPGTKNFRKIQIGPEVTPGTGVLATGFWRGEGTLQDETQVVNPNEDVGFLMQLSRAYIPYQAGSLALTPIPATFEQLPYLCAMGIKNVVTGTADGAGTGKIYPYPFPTGYPKPTTKTYSLEGGDEQQMEKATYAYLKQLKLSGKVKKSLDMSGILGTRTVAPSNITGTGIAFDNTHHITDTNNGLAIFPIGCRVLVSGSVSNNGVFTVTASAAGSLTVTENTAIEAAGGSVTVEQWFTNLALPSVEEMVFQKSQLYIDPTSSSAGTTLKSNTVLAYDFVYNTGLDGLATADGRLDYSQVVMGLPSGSLKVDFYHEGSAIAEKAAWRNKTPRVIRLQIQGTKLATAGTTYSYKTLIVDLYGYWSKFSNLGENAGIDTVTGEFTMAYDPTAASAGQILIVNSLASLP